MFYTSSLIYRRNKLFARQFCDCGLGFMSRERKGDRSDHYTYCILYRMAKGLGSL